MMKKLTFKVHIYLGFSLLIAILIGSLLYLSLLFDRIDIAHTTLENIKLVFLATSALAFTIIVWLLVYATKAFEHQNKIGRLIRKSNTELSALSKEKEADNWILSGLAALDDRTRGGRSEREIAANAIQTICQYVRAKVGVVYLKSTSSEEVFVHVGSYAASATRVPPKIMKNQGLVGESIASKEQLVLSDLPGNYLTVRSAVGRAKPTNTVIQPFIYEEEVLGVMEIGFFRSPGRATLQFLQRAGVTLAVASKVAHAHTRLTHLYEETQQQAEELEAQQEELRVQQEELKHANLELEEKARLLEERNLSIEQARQSITLKVSELEQSSKYKSEFLANMSHELRTPLNSILILAKLLHDNKSGNLSLDEAKYASVIHSAGTDLLNLINNILDLSKIESGAIELMMEDIPLSSVAQDLLELFGSVADNKAIDFRITVDEQIPHTITTDEQRLKQVLKNLLANAFKFTNEEGKVELLFAPASKSPAWKPGLLGEPMASEVLAVSVSDTGIGIPEDKQQLIFEAFKQADGSTSRRFGGTGLGLSICRQLATRLGGHIHVSSQEGKGSTFTLFLPRTPQGAPATAGDAITGAGPATHHAVTGAEQHQAPVARPIGEKPRQKRLLIVEDDQNFAGILEMYAHERGFETLTAHQGDTGLQMATDQLPDAIILDIMLPVMDGWTVLKNLKDNPRTRYIPVHLMSADQPGKHKIEAESIGFLKKPVDDKSLDDVFRQLHKTIASPLKKVLVVEDHEVQSDSLKSRLMENGVEVTQAFTGSQTLDALKSEEHYDCIILDINLPDKSGVDLLDDIKLIAPYADTPIIINTAMELTAETTGRILQHAKTMVLKSDKSHNRILDEVNLFINRVKNDVTTPGPLRTFNHSGSKALQLDRVLDGKRILLADDDMRNIFALSTVFASYKIVVETASSGREALDALHKDSNFDLVLMDIMMPEMDGYEAITKIRGIKKFSKLPVIALTAKAMRGDRQRILDVGANDYIAKPVDVDKLLSLMRVWLS